MRAHYGRDPYWRAAMFNSTCGYKDCRQPITKGDQIFYYPNTKTALARECGHADAASDAFDAAKADEENMR
jgi:hypothetical protein